MSSPWQRFTDEQRRAAFLVDRSVVSTAAAGSGKTQVMAVRYIACLLRDDQRLSPERILAITFTREAAGNLRARIDAVLRAILAQPQPSFPDYLRQGGEDAELSQEDIDHLTRSLSELPAAPIGTVDSFCLSLVADHADRLGRDPGMAPPGDDGPEWRQCQEAAWLALRQEAVRDAGGTLSLLVAAYGEASVRALIGAMAEQCAALPNARATAAAEDPLVRFLALRRPQREALHDALARLQGHLADSRAKGAVAERLRAIPPPPAWDDPADPRQARIYAGWLCHFAEVKVAGKDEVQAALVREVQDALDFPCLRQPDGKRAGAEKRLRCASLAAFAGWDPDDEERYARRAQALGRCIERYRELLEQVSAERAISGFTSIARACLDLLHLPEVARAQAERFRHVLLDEAQDLNLLQGAIIERIWEVLPSPHVFAVGDHRQSIYGFRHAQPAQFQAWESAIDARGGASAPLGQNFRSHPLLVEGVRGLFSILELAQAFQVQAIRPGRDAADFPPARFACWQAEGEDAALAEARLTAELIVGSIASGRRPEHHAVLLRTRSRMRQYAEELERAGVSVDTDFPSGLYHAQECWDVEAILRLCLDPLDRFALACAVSGPWGVDDPQDRRLLVEALSAPRSEEAAERVRQGTALAEVLGRIAPILRSEGPASALRALAADPRLVRRYASLPLARRRLANLVQLAQAGLAGGAPVDPTAFLERISERRRLGADGAEAGGESLGSRGVRLMTVHAAKGLEWPVVILPEMAVPFLDRDRRQVAVARAGARGLEISCGAARGETSCALGRLTALEALGGERRAEDARLFYVATTRAVEELHLIRSGAPHAAAEVRSCADWVERAGCRWEPITPAATAAVRLPAAAARTEALPELASPAPAAQVVVRSLSELLADPDAALPQDGALDADPASALRRELGIRVHEALQRHGLGMPAEHAHAACAGFHGLLPEGLLQGVERSMASRGWVTGLPADGAQLREQPVVSRLVADDATRLVSGVIDLLVRDADGHWHLYDYKTGETAGAEDDRLQVRCYAEMLAPLLEGGVRSAHLLDLRHGVAIPVPLGEPAWPVLLRRWDALEGSARAGD